MANREQNAAVRVHEEMLEEQWASIKFVQNSYFNVWGQYLRWYSWFVGLQMSSFALKRSAENVQSEQSGPSVGAAPIEKFEVRDEPDKQKRLVTRRSKGKKADAGRRMVEQALGSNQPPRRLP